MHRAVLCGLKKPKRSPIAGGETFSISYLGLYVRRPSQGEKIFSISCPPQAENKFQKVARRRRRKSKKAPAAGQKKFKNSRVETENNFQKDARRRRRIFFQKSHSAGGEKNSKTRPPQAEKNVRGGKTLIGDQSGFPSPSLPVTQLSKPRCLSLGT